MRVVAPGTSSAAAPGGKFIACGRVGRSSNLLRAAPEVAKHAEGRPVRKVIVVPGRLVNVVV